MTKIKDLHQKWSRDPEYQKSYDDLAEEFAFAKSVIEARRIAGLTQLELATRMKTTQSVVSRLESGGIKPTMRTLEKVAAATGTHLRVSFEGA